MDSFLKAESNFLKFFKDEIEYIFDRQTDISKYSIALDLKKLKDPRFEKILSYYDPKTFHDKYDEDSLEKEREKKIDPDEDILLERPFYLDKVAEFCDEKVFICPKCNKGDMNFIEMRQHIYICPQNYIRNYFSPEITFEPETNGELNNFVHQYIKKQDLYKAAYNNIPNQSHFMEEHINTAKENPAFKMFVSLLEREIRDKQTPIITKEDQKRKMEETFPDNADCRKTEIKEEKARIYMTSGERVWGTDLKNNSLTLKHTFFEQKLFNPGVDGAS